MIFEVNNKGICFTNKIYFGGSISFNNSNNKKFIYLMGPIFSLLMFIISLILHLNTSNRMRGVFVLISLLSVILVSLPLKDTDIYKILKKEVREG